MSYVAPRAALLSVALGTIAACEENCQDACQRQYSECVGQARTADEKAVCDYHSSVCLNKCPAPRNPQLSAGPDE
jgi:hypothetical protein